jgi:hypothetical protein
VRVHQVCVDVVEPFVDVALEVGEVLVGGLLMRVCGEEMVVIGEYVVIKSLE